MNMNSENRINLKQAIVIERCTSFADCVLHKRFTALSNNIKAKAVGRNSYLLTVFIIFFCFCSDISFALDAVKSQQYKLLMSKDKKMCPHMLEIFNQDLKKYGQNGDYHQRESEEFQSIPWIPIEGQEKKEYGEPASKFALIDLNNDGIEDYVVKYGDCCFHNRYIGGVYMLDKSVQELPYKTLSKEISNTSNQIFLMGDIYKLEIREADISPEIVEVFKYGGIHYIAMHESLEMNVPDHGYVVIAKYTGGKITFENQAGLKDICYFRRIKIKK